LHPPSLESCNYIWRSWEAPRYVASNTDVFF
jgi:hypothetical protein